MKELKEDLKWQLEKCQKQWSKLYEECYKKCKELDYWKQKYEELKKSS